MGTSGNPAKKAVAKKTASAPSDVTAFKKRALGIMLPLPSGLVVRAKRVEIQTFILNGNVPNPLMQVVSEALEKGQKADIEKIVGVEEGGIDLETVREMYDLVEAIVIESIQEPKVHPVPEDPENRDDDLLYVDEVDDEDKMFIYQWASGGTADIEQFREEARANMATLAEKQGALSASK